MECGRRDSLDELGVRGSGSWRVAEALTVCWGVETLRLVPSLGLLESPLVLWLLRMLQNSDPMRKDPSRTWKRMEREPLIRQGISASNFGYTYRANFPHL